MRSWPTAILVAAASFFIYFLTMSQNFSFDALTNALACESGQAHRWFHPNHLFYPFLGALWFQVERFFGYQGFSIYSLERLHIIFSSLGMGLFFLTLRRLCSLLSAVAATLFLAFSYAVWQNTVDAMFAGLAIFFNIALVAAIADLGTRRQIQTRHVAGLSLLSVIAILVHGIAIFHLIPISLWLLSRRQAAVYLAAVGSAIFALYGVVYAVVVAGHVPQNPIAYLYLQIEFSENLSR
jgi:hypothetical protein